MVDKPVRHWHKNRQSLKENIQSPQTDTNAYGTDLNVIKTALQGETDWESNTETIHCVATDSRGGLPW